MARKEIPMTDCIGVAVKNGDVGGVIIYGPDSEILNFIMNTESLDDYEGARFVAYEAPIEVPVSYFRALSTYSRTVRIEKTPATRKSRKSA